MEIPGGKIIAQQIILKNSIFAIFNMAFLRITGWAIVFVTRLRFMVIRGAYLFITHLR